MKTDLRLHKAITLLKTGKYEKPSKILDKLLKEDPDNYDYNNIKSIIDVHKSNFKSAICRLKKFNLLDGNPSKIAALNTCGLAYEGLGDFPQAKKYFIAAFKTNPQSFEIGMNLAGSYKKTKEFKKSIDILKSLELQNNNDKKAALNALLGEAHYELGDSSTAFKMFDKSINFSQPGNILPLNDYIYIAEKFEHHLMRKNSCNAANKALRFYPNEPALLLFLAKSDYSDKNYAKGIERLSALSLKASSTVVKTGVYNELGILSDANGDYDDAYHYFMKSNKSNKATYQSENLKPNNQVQESLTIFSDDLWLKNWKLGGFANKGHAPTFLIGFPRSGTTLLENILDGHSNIETLPEIEILRELKKSLHKTHGNYPSCLSKLSNLECQQLQEMYYEILNSQHKVKGSELYIDKLPLNIKDLGLIKKIFPDAKIILAIRHPADCTLSCFMQNFAPNQEMAHFLSLEKSVKRYKDIFELWNLYVKNLDITFHLIRYEDLIDNPEEQTSLLLAYLGLEYEKSVMNYSSTAKSKGFINTPSYRQISQPIYKNSKYRWKNYEKQFGELTLQLAPFITQLGY